MDRNQEFLALRGVSIAARGLWFDISALAEFHSTDGTISVSHLPRMSGVDLETIRGLIKELVACGIVTEKAGRLTSAAMRQRTHMKMFRERAAKARESARAEVLSRFKPEA